MNEQQQLTLWDRIYNGLKQVPTTVVDTGSDLFKNIMLGREPKEPESVVKNQDGNVVIQTGVNNGGRKGGVVGFVGDVLGGAKENMNTSFAPKNLYSNDRKGFGYRLGEGLGSAVRLLDNPLVRGAVAYGLSKHMGDSNPLEQGFIATGTNMRNKAVDRVYRNDLINSRKASLMNNPNWNTLSPEEENEIMTRVTSMAGYSQMPPEQQKELLSAARTNYLNNRQQEQIRAVENEINGYRGFIDNSIYDNMIKAQQLRDNAEYRQMYFDAQQRNLEAQRDWQRQQAERENQLRAQQLYLTGRGQDLDYALGTARLAQEAEKNNKGKVDIDKLNGVKTQLENFDNIFESVNNPYRYRIFGGASEKLNTFSPEESNFMTQANLLFNIISRDLGGEKGVLSDQDIQRIKEGMPKLQDTIDQKRAKMSAIYSLLEIKLGQHGIPFNNPYDIYGRKKEQTTSGNNQAITTTNQPKTNTSKSNTTKSGVKYEVIN